MSREYVDFWVRLEPGTAEQVVEKLMELGFKVAVAELVEGVEYEGLREAAGERGLKLYRKLVLEPRRRRELLDALGANRGRYETVSVVCRTLEVALVAARDSRVDSLIIPPNHRYRIDKGVAALLRNNVEIPFNWFLEENKLRSALDNVLEIMRSLALRKNVIVSSGASDPLGLRSPFQLASLLQVFGVERGKALDSVSSIPLEILRVNLLKLSPNYVARGVMRID